MSEPGAALQPPEAQPGWLARLGLAVTQPRWALTLAADRSNAGRAGQDLIAAIAVVMLATQLRGLATAVWLALIVAPGFGLRAAARVLTDALTVDLVLLPIGALIVFALAGARRNLGRAFDLACVAVLPLVVVNLVATVAVRAAGVAVPAVVSWGLSGVSYAWFGMLIALAIRPARGSARQGPAVSPPSELVRPARRVGAGLVAVAAIGIAVQVAWIAGHLELVKPMNRGDAAPAIALPRIGAGGVLGERVTLAESRGKIVVIDFWATWCKPCLAAMPKLDQLTRANPDITVIAINLDDAAAARALFDQRRYAMTLVADDGDASDRFGVSSIPHTVVIDRHGVVREVVRGSGADLASVVAAIRAE